MLNVPPVHAVLGAAHVSAEKEPVDTQHRVNGTTVDEGVDVCATHVTLPCVVGILGLKNGALHTLRSQVGGAGAKVQSGP